MCDKSRVFTLSQKNKNPKSGTAFHQHDGYKSPSEDRLCILEILPGFELYSVFDGHGGDYVANFISSELTNSIASLVRELLTSDYVGDTTEKIKEIMHEQFLAIDEKLVASNPTRRGGSTGVVCITTPTKIIVANVGDSPCIAFSNRKVLIDNRTHVVPADDEINCTELCLLHETNGHNPTNPLEEARIQWLQWRKNYFRLSAPRQPPADFLPGFEFLKRGKFCGRINFPFLLLVGHSLPRLLPFGRSIN